MILEYIFGDSGSGKFSHCTSSILERQNNTQKSILIIPEQFTMQAEKEIIEKSPNNILFNTQVLNFKRLAHRVFTELGLPMEKPLEDIGQIMIIRKIIHKLSGQDKLRYFDEKSYTNIGLLEKISAVIKEFSSFDTDIETIDITIKNLEKNSLSSPDSKNENLVSKLSDLKEIYSEYKIFLKKDYVTDEEVLELLYTKLNHSELVDKDTHVYIYGFEEFNNQELDIVKKLFEKCEKMHIYFMLNSSDTYFPNVNIFDNYYNIKQTINRINDKILIKLNIKIDKVIFLNENIRHSNNAELKHLQKNFLLYQYEQYQNDVNAIYLTEAKNKYVEIENIAINIIATVKNENYNFKDICVILGDSSYQSYLKMTFNKYNIPYFLDDKKNIINHSLVEVITSVIDIILYNFQYESIFRYLKSGYLDTLNICNLNKTDINLIENYILKYGIKGNKWKKNFTYGFHENSPYSDEKINTIRKNILKTLKKFDVSKTKKYTATEICTKIIDFMVDIKVTETTKSIIERDSGLFEDNILNNAGITDEHIQVFNGVGNILQKIVDLLGDEKMTLLEFSKILKSAFEKQTISIIPPTQDQILIGNFDRTKITTHKIIFAVGLNEGYVPSYKEETPFISDVEKIILHKSGIEMRNSTTTMISTDLLKIYALLLKAQDKLILSYSLSSLAGDSKKESVVISKVRSIFPYININQIDKSLFSLQDTPEIIFENIFINLSEFDDENLHDDNLINSMNWFLNNEHYAEKLKKMEESLSKIDGSEVLPINHELLCKLYKDSKIFSSISKLEEFNKCPFSYFLKYNLKIHERDLCILDYLKIGNIYHEILEEFSKKVFERDVNFSELNRKDIHLIIDKIANEIDQTQEISNMFTYSAKYRYYFERVKKITTMSAEAILRQLNCGNFIPENFEVDFDTVNSSHVKIPLKNDFDMILKGKIDRVDKMNIGEEEYIKIIDYKSSENKFEIQKVYYGIQLQLLMYLNTFMKIQKDITNKNIQPAGAFYFQIQEAILNGEEFDNDKPLKEFDLKGVISKEDKILLGFDKNNSSGKLKNIQGIAPNEILSHIEFQKLLKLADNITKKLGCSITEGNINISPHKYEKDTSCKHCKFDDICNFEIIDKKNKCKNLPKIDKNEIWKKIDDELSNDEN